MDHPGNGKAIVSDMTTGTQHASEEEYAGGTHRRMISLTRLNHVPLVVNSDLIEHIEVTPDTVVALTTGQKILVLETAEEIVERIVQFRRRIMCDLPSHSGESRLGEKRQPEDAENE